MVEPLLVPRFAPKGVVLPPERAGRASPHHPGVAAVGLGWDCTVRGPHVHIRPHAPAVVVEAARGADPAEVKKSILAALPGLLETPFVVAPRPDPLPGF